MKNALIICTYMRPHSLQKLLKSIMSQSKRPEQIIIVDGSTNQETKDLLFSHNIGLKVDYFLVEKEHRGLTKQRNYGVSMIGPEIEIVSFLDDDVVLERNYFEEILSTFSVFPNSIGVGGIDLKENTFFKVQLGVKYSRFSYYKLDGWVCKESLRNKARKIFGLMPKIQPDLIPEYSHGRSGFPPNGKVYRVEHLIGMSMSFRKKVFENLSFSKYFEGYGLYEDFDFCVRALKFGELYVNTSAQVWHYHEPSGRPDTYKYGKMVIRNGWYVWKQRFPTNSIDAKLKWHATAFLLALIRLVNSITGPNRLDSFKEFIGRVAGWFSLWFNKPKLQ